MVAVLPEEEEFNAIAVPITIGIGFPISDCLNPQSTIRNPKF
jgi:hypothetical protein